MTIGTAQFTVLRGKFKQGMLLWSFSGI